MAKKKGFYPGIEEGDRLLYSDEEVHANFDFRDYITNTKEPGGMPPGSCFTP